MRSALIADCEELRFPPEATAAFCAAREALLRPETGVEPLWREAEENLLDGHGKIYVDRLAEAAALVPSVPRETADMVFFLSCLPALRERYRANGLSEDLFRNTMEDLRWKLAECRRVRGLWGTFVPDWYAGFYRVRRFGLGRLQYERRELPFEVPGVLPQGATVCGCHIPSAGPLTEESVTDSLRRAAAFFADVRANGAFPLVCHSWLLYPPLVALFPAGSNMAKFAARFQVYNTDADPANKDAWRVFDRPFDPEKIAELPEDNSLRRALKSYLAAGNIMGNGYGFLLFKE